MAENLVEVSQLRKTYGAFEALKGISFSLARGEILGYLGPNGAGKSTTVKILAGLIQKTLGQVRVCGFDLDASPLEIKRRLGYLPENVALYESLTAVEYLQFIARLHGLPEAQLNHKIEKFVDIFQIKAESRDRMSAYSKGMKQKVAIAASLIHDPEVVLFDEPLNGLDTNAAFVVKEILRSLAREGKSVLFCSHVMEVVERLCDRAIIIDHGTILADGKIGSLTSNASLEETFRKMTGASDLAVVTEEFLRELRKGPP
jgi:ABC-2 type transport system ATP-binding protein